MDKIVPIGFTNRTCAVCGSKLQEINKNGNPVDIALPYAVAYYCSKCNKRYHVSAVVSDGKVYRYASDIDREHIMIDRFYEITKNGYKNVSFGGWTYEVSLY